MEAVHWAGANEPLGFESINDLTEKTSVDILNNKDAATYSSGDIKVSISKKPKTFSVDFQNSKGELLTQLGFRSLGFVSDKREHTGVARPFMTAQFGLEVGEKVYGLGERFGPFVKNGQRVDIWNADGGTSSEQTYKNIPFYLTSNGYGIFVASTDNVSFEVQSERTNRVNIVVPGEKMKIYVIRGETPKDILRRYDSLTGLPALPPPWTFGLWLSTSFTTSYDVETVRKFVGGMRDRKIPLSTFHFDCFWMRAFHWCDFVFDPECFPDAKSILKQLKDEFGIRICVWINSYIGQASHLFKEGKDNGYLIKKSDGSVFQTDLWQAGMGIVDFTNPQAWKWFQSKLQTLVDIGVDAFKTDFGERIPVYDVKYHDGSNPEQMHNYYTYLYNKCVFELLEKNYGKDKACLFARSGTSGSQQFPVHWGGDCESTFVAMADSLRGGLSLTLSGFGYWSHDIGGFEGDPDPAVYKRWVAFGLLSSHSRLHGSGSYRVPWLFDDEASVVLKRFTNLKLSLMPYIFANAIEAHETGIPVMRAALLEAPNDPTAWLVDQQFYLGANLLVCPVFSGASGKVTFYVPETPSGKPWYGYLDGKIRTSGKWHTETHDFKSLPLLVRPNSVVISGARDDVPEYEWNNGFVANVYAVEETSAKIPCPKNVGHYAAEVKASASGKILTVSAEGKIGDWSVRVLGDKVVSVQGGDIQGDLVAVHDSKVEITLD
jgi:alpha-D-xyloside xylohydrolase